MESVNLDMEDIFEEEAAEDDFPSVGPLPDLPEAEEGTEANQDEDSADVMAKLKDLSKGAAKKVVRRPMPKLDSQRLCGERGIPILPKVFEKVQFKGKGHEGQDLRIIMRYLEHWAHRLFPMMPFDEVLERIEKLGTKKEVQTCIKKMRLDMPLLNDDYVHQTSDDEVVGDDKDKSPTKQNGASANEEEWDDIIRDHEEEERKNTTPSSQPATPMSHLMSQLSKPLQDLKSSTPKYTATPLNSTSSSGGLTPEQRERIERNKQLALQKKLGKQGFKVPAVPGSPFRAPQSPVPQRSPMIQSPSQSSPYKHSPSSTSTSAAFDSSIPNTPELSNGITCPSLQNGHADDTELPISIATACTNFKGDNSGSENQDSNLNSQSQNEMSEVIPIIGKAAINKESSQESGEVMSEVIPNQDHKRQNDNDIKKNHSSPKKQKIDDELSEDEILLSLGDN